MERKACWNCRHGSRALDLGSLGAPGGSECRCSASDFPWHIYGRYRRFEELLPLLCGHYEPLGAGQCPQCGTELGAVRLVEYWASGVFSVLPCCSPACLTLLQARLDAERDALVPEPQGRS